MPRAYAFEVSYKGMLIFSKIKGGYWPNLELVSYKCMMAYMDDRAGKSIDQWLAGNTPLKEGGFRTS